MQEFDNNKPGDLEISKDLQKINKDDLLVSYDFNCLYPMAQADRDTRWPAIDTSYPLTRSMSEAACELFNSGRWVELKRSAFLTVNYHNLGSITFQLIPMKEKINNPFKNIRLEEVTRCRNGIIINILKSVDIIDIVKCRGVDLEEYDGFFCYNMHFNPYVDFFKKMVAKRNLFKKLGKQLFQTLDKKS